MSIVENSYPNQDLQSAPLELLLFQEAVAEIVLWCNSLIISVSPHLGKKRKLIADDGVVWNVHFPFVGDKACI